MSDVTPAAAPPPLPIEAPAETSKKALAAFLLSLLTPCCFVAGPIAIVLGFLAMREIDQAPVKRSGRGLAIAGISIGGLFLIVGIGLQAAIGLPALARAREAARRATCQQNMKHIGKILLTYSQREPDGQFPPLSSFPGEFMFEAASVFPEYVTDTTIFECPSDVEENMGGVRNTADGVNCWSYVYLGYVIMNDDEMDAFMLVYEDYIADAKPFHDDLPAPPGRGSFGGDTFIRLGDRAERIAKEKGIGSDKIPVIWDMAADYGDDTSIVYFNHIPGGSNVLYLDGHTEYVKYSPEQATWPMTNKFLKHMGEWS